MKLKINEKPKLTKIKFSCDDPLHKKLDNYELTKDFLNNFNTTALIGTQGSGKTSLTVNLVKQLYKKCFHYIYVFMPQTSRNSLDNNIFDKHLPEEQIYDELTIANINELYEKIKENSENGYKSLVIYDDVQKSLKDYQILKNLKSIIANQRHLKVVNLILLQNWFALDKSLRELINNVILFKLNKSQNEKIFNEIIETHKDKFDNIRKLVFNKPYTWLFINMKSQRMFKEWDEIIFDDDDESDIEIEIKKNKKIV